VKWAPAPGEVADPALILVQKDEMAAFYIHGHWLHADQRRMPNHIQGTVEAYVNDSRWVVQCPGCNGAQLASRNDHRFFCVDCLNADNGGHWLRVVWPKDHAEIEAALLQRPNPKTRHWRPGETVADLVRETEEHLS
jgi:hypothetical protein